MAQQTINVGTAPNDGTGTPLRTAFQYTNSNFSELYTAVGPSGNNIVVPGNATITGDLTVDTSTLKVDSTNNTVGIGNATPPVGASNTDIGLALGAVGTVRSVLLGMQNCFGRIRERDAVNNLAITTNIGATGTIDDNTRSSWKIRIGSGNDNYVLQRAGIGSSTFQDLLAIDSGGVCVWSDGAGGTRMTLNSTGLGVGRSPSYRLQASSGTKATTASLATVVGITTTDADDFGIYFRLKTDATGANRYAAITSFDNGSGNGARDLVLQDLGGNVGIGVTPSAWAAGQTALQVKTGAIWTGGVSVLSYSNNVFYDGSRKYISTAGATEYQQTGSQHIWFTAPSGTSGTAITFTQAMTLDASGNFLVGKTASSATTVGVQAEPAGALVSTLAASTNATNTLICYSTGAAAYRFYVGLGGTVYATNTTISAISDARLKQNVQDIDVGLGAILALKPRKFDWKEGKGKNIKGDRGFIAQEFEQVFPQLVDEWKDAAPEGEAPYKSVRQDLIPVLVKAIQELTARVQTLETR